MTNRCISYVGWLLKKILSTCLSAIVAASNKMTALEEKCDLVEMNTELSILMWITNSICSTPMVEISGHGMHAKKFSSMFFLKKRFGKCKKCMLFQNLMRVFWAFVWNKFVFLANLSWPLKDHARKCIMSKMSKVSLCFLSFPRCLISSLSVRYIEILN